MTTAHVPVRSLARPPALHNGDRMSREEFHRAYAAMPEDFKAELIEGIVYVASPLSIWHSEPHSMLDGAFLAYRAATAGVQNGNNATVLLGDEGEPQPDVFLRILPEFGGQSKTTADGYVDGAPELVAEVAYSTRAIDLHAKRRDYRRYGVLEYIVANVLDQRLVWVDLTADHDMPVAADGIIRARTFPGLWLDSMALFRNDYTQVMAVLQQGLASPEHAAFVQRLAAAGPGKPAT
jgi:Uma2 family endonuclease